MLGTSQLGLCVLLFFPEEYFSLFNCLSVFLYPFFPTYLIFFYFYNLVGSSHVCFCHLLFSLFFFSSKFVFYFYNQVGRSQVYFCFLLFSLFLFLLFFLFLQPGWQQSSLFSPFLFISLLFFPFKSFSISTRLVAVKFAFVFFCYLFSFFSI